MLKRCRPDVLINCVPIKTNECTILAERNAPLVLLYCTPLQSRIHIKFICKCASVKELAIETKLVTVPQFVQKQQPKNYNICFLQKGKNGRKIFVLPFHHIQKYFCSAKSKWILKNYECFLIYTKLSPILDHVQTCSSIHLEMAA